MSDKSVLLASTIVLIVVGLWATWNFMLWDECRETNSFTYCVRIIVL